MIAELQVLTSERSRCEAPHQDDPELSLVLGSSPITQLIPVPLIAELAAATILGIEVFQQNGREIDLDQVASVLAAGVRLIGAGERSSPS